MGRIWFYMTTAWIGLVFLMAGVAGALAITEYWHAIGHEHFATCFGVPGASEHAMMFMALTLIVSGAVAAYVNSWQKDGPADLDSGLLTGIAMLLISSLLTYLMGDVQVNSWYNLAVLLAIALALIGLPTAGALAFSRAFMRDERNGKNALPLLLATMITATLAFSVLPEMLVTLLI
jgi:hypothetical protein